jgi:hypothetical protein
MKKLLNLLSTSALLAASASAATITWESATIGTAADVSTEGTPVFAYSIAGTETTTVNTVDFIGDDLIDGTLGDDLTTTPIGYANYVNYSSPASATGAYADILTTGSYKGGTTDAVYTLNNLSIGQEYLIQFWINDSRATDSNRFATIADSGVTVDFNTADAIGGAGQYVIGTFIADSTSETFTLNAVSGNQQLNAIQLRAIPEPGTYALIGGVISLSSVALRRRKS